MNVTAAAAPTPLTPRLHPLLATAALAVTTVSFAGIAAMSGLLPMSNAAEATARVEQQAMPPAGSVAPASTSRVAPIAPAAKTPARSEKSLPARTHAPATVAAEAPAVEPPAPVAPVCARCGIVESLREVKQEGDGSGLGMIVGGLLGGIVGNQVSKGSIGTVLGAAGGAYAGHRYEKSRNESKHVEIGVRMNDGSLRVVEQDNSAGWRRGDRVRIDNGLLLHAEPAGIKS